VNILLIIGGIFLGIAAMLGLFAHTKIAAIWVTFVGIVFFVAAAFTVFHATVSENEAHETPSPPPLPVTAPSPIKVPSETATESPVATGTVKGSPIATPSPAVIVNPTPITPAAPAPTLPTTPTPEIKSDTPYVTEMTPEEVARKLQEAKKHGTLKHVRKALVNNVRLVGKLLYWAAEYTDDNTKVSAFFVWRSGGPDAVTTDLMVSFELPMEGHAGLPLRDRYFEFMTEGVINEVTALDVVHLKEVKITPDQ
jgi:hypothetical protein